MAEIYIYYSLLGMVAGLLAGLFGVGGGLIIVPALYYLLLLQGVSEQVVMHIAIGTSLATIILTSISSAFSHYRQQAIVINAFIFLAPGLLVGAAMSAVIADYLAKDYLVVIFALFEIAVAVQMGMALKMNAHRQLPRAPAVATAGVGIGLLSGLVGIGGGSLTVPYLSWHNVPIKKAIGTSAACGLPIAVAGMAGFLLAGIDLVSVCLVSCLRLWVPSWRIAYPPPN